MFLRHRALITLLAFAVSTTSGSALTLSQPALPAAPVIPNRTVNLNAPNDGVTDATAAINTAIASLASEGGGTLLFGSGTYLVSVNPDASDFVLQVQSSVRLLGASDGSTVIQMSDWQPGYNTMFGTGWTVHDVDIENITIDMDGENNPIESPYDIEAGPRFAIRVDAGPRVRVGGCTFLNVVDVNTVVFSGTTITDVEVAYNTFSVGQAPGSYDFDHSTVYTHGVRMWVHDNTFNAAYGIGTPDARCAIEIHGNDMTVTHNTVNAYSIGVNITGRAVSSDRQLYNNNIINNTMNGMEIYSQYYSGQGEYGIQNLTIENNQINLDPFDWRNTGLVDTNQPSMGIFLTTSPSQPVPINGVAITGNQITFPTGGTPEWGDSYSGGVILWTYNGEVIQISNLTVSGNTIENALGPAIWTNIPLKQGTVVSSNTIVNPARSSASNQQTGVYISNLTENIQVTSNAVSDMAKPPLITSGTSALSRCQSSCSATSNTVYPSRLKAVVAGSGWIVH